MFHILCTYLLIAMLGSCDNFVNLVCDIDELQKIEIRNVLKMSPIYFTKF